MDVKITALDGIDVTGSVRMLACDGKIGFYMAKMAVAANADGPAYNFETTLTAGAPAGGTAPSPAKIVVPVMLPVAPSWDVVLTASGTGEVAYTSFGGGWNSLVVDALKSGELTKGYSYLVEATDKPNFVTNNGSAAAQQYVSAIFSGYQLGIIGLQEQDGQQVPHVSGIVGTSEAPVSTGRVYGDLSNGLPTNVNVVYLTNKNVGPLAPGGAFCGSLFFANYDVNQDKLSTPVALLEGVDFCDFDIAVADDYFCLFAVTGDGAPLIALYDQTGKAQGSPNMPVGSWSNAGCWVTNPTIVATPGSDIGFSFAFIEMDGDAPSGIYTGTLSSPPLAP